ncbi:MAG TPA: sulfite dehydrogenase [Terriglobales bacterium]|nr:sulfite dehydrogenase [Terriglobales bacterium]
MDSNGSGRRRFLKRAAALAGVAAGAGAGAEWAAKGQSIKPEVQAHDAHVHRTPSRRGVRMSVDHITYYTPLQDYSGIITPSRLHFVQYHASHFPEIDVQQHRLTIHGLVDRPMSFTVDELKSLPSVTRIHFLECHANSSPQIHHAGNQNMGLPVQYIHGMTSCSEWTGVPLSVLLNEVGLKKEASWLVSEGADPGKFSHTLPMAKAMEDVLVAYGQNGEPLRVEQGYPIRLLVPGWEAPFSVKYLRHIKVVDQPYHAWNEAMNHSIPRDDLGGKARWYHFQFGPKSVITRPSAGLKVARPGYVQVTGIAWSGGGVVKKVDVSTDGGLTWKEAKLQAPVLPRAHTRFTFDWAWDGQEAVIMSRCTDELDEVQPSRAELYANWGISEEESKKPPSRAIHTNAMQPWKVARDGSVHNAMFLA